MKQELLDILCCPETHQSLQVAEETLVADLNSRMKAGKLHNRAGKPVGEEIESGLIRQDRKCLYPVRAGIPIMLIDEAIPL